MEEGLVNSSSMILLVSPTGMKSGWVEEEYTAGISFTQKSKGSFRVIPILIANAELPAFLSTRSWIDLRNKSEFNNQLDLLAKTILGDNSRTIQSIVSSNKTKNHLDLISFMIFFPEGLLKPILNDLIKIRGCQEAIKWSMENDYLEEVDNSGVQLVRIFPEKVNTISSQIKNKSVVAGKLLDQLVNQIFLNENPFSDVIELGFGRAILLRDLIETAIISKSYDFSKQNKVCVLARENLGRIIDEEFYRVALEISDRLTNFIDFMSPEDFITKAKILARAGKANQAVQLFDLYRGDNLFGDLGLDEIDRIDAAMSWAKAVKESGAARQSNIELKLAYDNMLSLLNTIIKSSTDNESLLMMKADILNNRATQIAVYGNDIEWEKVQDDFNQIFDLYKKMNNNRKLVGALSNYVAHSIDRLEKNISSQKSFLLFDKYDDIFRKYDDIANKMDFCEELFFYYYQKARFFKRKNQTDTSQAIEYYKLAYDVAYTCGLKRRYPIAKRWELILRKRTNKISETDFLRELSECASILKSQTQDAWALNSFCDISVELAQTHKVRGEYDNAWKALVEASKYRIMQYAYSGSPRAYRGIIDLLKKMDCVEMSTENKNSFIKENKTLLNAVMKFHRTKMLEWNDISLWLTANKKGVDDGHTI